MVFAFFRSGRAQFWGVLVREKWLSPRSEEPPHNTLPSDLTVTYLKGGRTKNELVGKGEFFSWSRKDDEVTPASMYSKDEPVFTDDDDDSDEA